MNNMKFEEQQYLQSLKNYVRCCSYKYIWNGKVSERWTNSLGMWL